MVLHDNKINLTLDGKGYGKFIYIALNLIIKNLIIKFLILLNYNFQTMKNLINETNKNNFILQLVNYTTVKLIIVFYIILISLVMETKFF